MEGDCSICFDPLSTGNQQLAYCATCGGNFHEDCTEQWFKESRGRLCPLCRGLWPSRNVQQNAYLPHLHQADFELHRDWLYSGHVSLEHAIQRDDFKPMVQAYLFSLYVEDAKFGTAILQGMLDGYAEGGTYPDQGAIALAYGTFQDDDAIIRAYRKITSFDLPGLHRLQRFLVDTYMAVAHANWFEDEDWDTYPREFLRDLVVAMFHKHPAKSKWNIDAWKADLEDEESNLPEQN